jgi:hypothetical protein
MNPRSLALILLAGALLGIVSRLTDTASWAPGWLGNVFTPWLGAAWLVGASARTPRSGAVLGLALLLATVGGYLVVAATSGNAGTLAPRLLPLALLAGPSFGAAGATWRGGTRYAPAAGALLGASVVVEGLILLLGPHSVPERLIFAAESLAGVVLLIGLVTKAPRQPA